MLLPEDGRPEDDLGDEERELLPPRLLGREPELLAGDISVPDFFSSSALFSCFVQHLACCWCYLCDFSMTYSTPINQIDPENRCSANKEGATRGWPLFS